MDSVSTPLVSIAVITYNSSKYVLETLESAKAQTYQNIELIISDDCSTDNTVQICKDWVEQNINRFVRTQIIETPQNTGVSANCNRAEDACQGEWVKLIAGDDILLHNCIDDYIEFIKEKPDAVYVFGKIYMLGGEESLKKYFFKAFDYNFFNLSREQQFDRLLFQGNCIPAASSFYNVVRTRQLNLRYDERIPMLEDLPRWINALKSNIHFFFLDKYLVCYRLSPDAISHSKKYNVRFFESNRLFFYYYQIEHIKGGDMQKIKQFVAEDVGLFYRNEYLSHEYNIIKESYSYKIGYWLINPFRKLKSVLKCN